jgi:hypothetical protein
MVLQRSGLHRTLDEGRLDLGQPSQVISRQLSPIHCARSPPYVFHERPAHAGAAYW